MGDAFAVIKRGAFAGEVDQLPAAGADFLQVGLELLQQAVAGGDADDGHVVVDQGQWAMFQLAGGVGFCVNVGNFLEFQRPFHRDGVMRPAAKEQGVVLCLKLLCQLGNRRGQLQRVADAGRQAAQGAHIGGDDFRGALAHLSQGRGEPQQCGELGGKRLGGGHANFRAGMGQQPPVCLTHQGAARHVANRQGAQVLLLAGIAQRSQGIGRFSGLGDGDQQGALGHTDLTVTVFAGDLDLTGQAGLLFDPVAGNHTGVVAGAAGDDVNIADQRQLAFSPGAEGGGEDMIIREQAIQRVGDGGGLLKDFLEHKVLILAFFHAQGRVLVLLHGVLDQLVLPVPDLAVVAGQPGVFAFIQIDEAVGYLQQRQGVGANVMLAAANADNQRAAHAGAIQGVGFILMDDAEGKGTAQFGQRAAQGAEHVLLTAVVVSQQVGDHFGVGLGGEYVAKFLQLQAQRVVILDDAVVDDSQTVGTMRVGVLLTGLAVGCPAGMGNAQVARERVCFHGIAECGNFTHFPSALDTVVATDDGHTGRIISPVFQTAQTLKKDTLNVPFRNRAYNSTHAVLPVC